MHNLSNIQDSAVIQNWKKCRLYIEVYVYQWLSVCPCRRTPMTVEELLLYPSLPLSSSPASPSLHLSPDDGQLCLFHQFSYKRGDWKVFGHLKWIFLKELILHILLTTTTNLQSLMTDLWCGFWSICLLTPGNIWTIKKLQVNGPLLPWILFY